MDIGISMAVSDAQRPDSIQIGEYIFQFVQELIPEKTLFGKIKTFDPKQHYPKKDSKALNKYGNGTFCRFSIKNPAYDRVRGVYALLDEDGLLYIGQTVNLRQRYNDGYGDIQPVNCYVGGQSTNCKINSMVLQKYSSGHHVYLFFYETAEYDRIEHELIEAMNPPYNSPYAKKYESRNKYVKLQAEGKRPVSPTKSEGAKADEGFEEIWQRIIQCAGETFVTKTQVPFQYIVVGDQVHPLHIKAAISKSEFIKAYELGTIRNVAHLGAHNVFGPTYVYAIMTDSRIIDAQSEQKEAYSTEKKERPSGTAHTARQMFNTNFCVGDRVEHFRFGRGTVKKVLPTRDDAILTVGFDTAGGKRLLERFANLKKADEKEASHL